MLHHHFYDWLTQCLIFLQWSLPFLQQKKNHFTYIFSSYSIPSQCHRFMAFHSVLVRAMNIACERHRDKIFVLYRCVTSSQSNWFGIGTNLTHVCIEQHIQLIHEQKCYKNRNSPFRCVYEPIDVFSKRQLFCVFTSPPHDPEHLFSFLLSFLVLCVSHLSRYNSTKNHKHKKRATRETWIKRQIDNSSEKHFMFYLCNTWGKLNSRNMYKCFTHAAHNEWMNLYAGGPNICMHHEEVYKCLFVCVENISLKWPFFVILCMSSAAIEIENLFPFYSHSLSETK